MKLSNLVNLASRDRGLASALRRIPVATRSGHRLRVVAFSPPGRSDGSIRELRRVFPDAQIWVRKARGLNQRDRVLRRHGPVDLVVVLSPAPASQHLRQLRELLPHLAPGGAYVVDRRVVAPGPGGLDAGLAKGGILVSRVLSDDRLVGVVKRHETLLKLRHAGSTHLINTRPDDLTATELAELPGGVLPAPRVTIHGNGPLGLSDDMPYPPLQLRRYEGDIAVTAGSIAYADGVVLPDSFRWHLADNLTHPRLVGVRGQFARPKAEPPTLRLSGAFYHLDYVNSGHYGHLMTEALSKFWGWEIAKAADPDLKLLSRTHPRYRGTDRVPPDIELLTRFGVDPSDIVRIDDPVRVDALVAATPMWHNQNPFSAHPGIAKVWDRLRERMIDPVYPSHERIFITRRGGARVCHNLDDVEKVFADAGFAVVYPGGMTQPQQATLFAGARVVAGFAGTGMFNLAYAHAVENVVVLSQDSYDARNEHLFAAVHGAAIDYFFSPADIAHPPGGWSNKAFHSPWSFDFDRHGITLDSLLKGSR